MSNTNNCAGASTGTIWITTTTTTVPTITGHWYNYIPPIEIVDSVKDKKENKDGCNCKKCKELFEYAEPNQSDGTFICYGCRHGW